MEELYTEKVQEALYHSLKLAKERNDYQVDICHLLKVFLSDSSSLFCNVLNKIGTNIKSVELAVDNYLSSIRNSNDTGDPKMSYDLSLLFSNSKKIANNMKDKYVSSEHLILSLFDNPNTIAKDIVRDFNLNKRKIEEVIKNIRGDNMSDSKNAEEKYEVLQRYGRDLVDLVAKGKIDPVIGRDDEIRRIMEILCRKTKNNPILIGEIL